MDEVGSVYVRLRPTATGFAEEAKTEVSGAVKSARSAANVPIHATLNRAETESTLKRDLGGAVKSTLAYVGGIFAAEKVFQFGKEVVTEAAQVQKAQESIRSAYGKSAEEIEKFSTGQATQFGISQVASDTASAKLGALFRNLGFGQKQSAGFNLELQKTVGGLSQIKGVDPTAILSKLNTTMATGTTRGLRDLGIALDSVTVKNEAMRLGLVKGVVDQGKVMQATQAQKDAQANLAAVQAKYGADSSQFHAATIKNVLAHEALKKALEGTAGPLTIQAKDQAILSLIQEKQSGIMKQAAAHQGDAANQMKVLAATWANAKASIGEALLPVLTEVVQELVKAVTFIKDNRTEFVGLAISVGIAVTAYTAMRAAMFAAKLGSEVLSAAQKILSGNIRFATTAMSEQQIEQEAATAGQEAYSAAIAAGATEQEAATAATEAATAAQDGLNASLLANPVGIVVVAVAALAFGLYELYEHSKTARRIMNELWADLKSVAGDALGWVAHTAIPWVADAIGGLVKWTQKEWKRWGDDVMTVVRFAWHYVVSNVKAAYALVRDVIGLFGDLIHGRWSNLWNDAKKIFFDILHLINARFAGLPGMALRVLEHVGRTIASEAGHLVHEALQLGKHIVEGIVHGIENAPKAVANAIKDKVTSAYNDVKSGFGIFSPSRVFAENVGKPISDGIVKGVEPLHDDLRDSMVTQINRLISTHGGTGGVWHDQFHDDVGQPISQGVVTGTSSLQHDLGTAIVNAAKGAMTHAKSALGIHSASALYAQQIGKPLADGIVHGMGGLEQALSKRLQGAVKSAASSVSGGSPAGPAPPGTATDWLIEALKITHHYSAANLNALYGRMMQESGGNPHAINLWDSNAAAGHPSKGLLQTIDSTFASYRLPGYGDIWNPIDNAIAAIRYMYAGYGHIVGPSATGYDQGGVVPGYTGQAQPAVVHGGEVIFTPEQMSMLSRRGITIQSVVVQTPNAATFISELEHVARSL